MGQEMFDTIRKTLETYNVEQDGELILQTYHIDAVVGKNIEFAICSILKKFNKEETVDMLYTITRELVLNGCKANQKRLFFEEQGFDIHDLESYQEGLQKYKDQFSRESAAKYALQAEQKDYHVKIIFRFNRECLTVEIRNKASLVIQEEKAIRSMLTKAEKYNDLAEFYLDEENQNHAEGAGLGIAMITILLKEHKISTELLRFIAGKEYTTVRLELPFSDNYVPIRKRNKIT